jgi:hypothetical protein
MRSEERTSSYKCDVNITRKREKKETHERQKASRQPYHAVFKTSLLLSLAAPLTSPKGPGGPPLP